MKPKKAIPQTQRGPRKGLHPRNRHRERYDFKLLIQSAPELSQYVSINEYGDESIDFANSNAVKALNRALLKTAYKIVYWDIPEGYLCPPIPGRADYIHHIADLLALCNHGKIPLGPSVRILDIGVGANCIYPILGHAEYGWSFLGSDTDPTALASAGKIVQSNSELRDSVELRLQTSPQGIFKELLKTNETFALSICNPPFHASSEEARKGSLRKWKGLGKEKSPAKSPLLNFGGQPKELWCTGGEAAFVGRMITESAQISKQCTWFSTLLSKESNLPKVLSALKKAKVQDYRILEMTQGQKKSRIIAWTYTGHGLTQGMDLHRA